jgi:hypothetical protein
MTNMFTKSEKVNTVRNGYTWGVNYLALLENTFRTPMASDFLTGSLIRNMNVRDFLRQVKPTAGNRTCCKVIQFWRKLTTFHRNPQSSIFRVNVTGSGLSIRNGVLIYKQLIRPVMDYAWPLRRSVAHIHVNKAQVLQSKSLRIATNAPWYVSNRQIHEDLGIPFFADHIRALTQVSRCGEPLSLATWEALVPI